MGSPTYINLSGFKREIVADELGINCSKLTLVVEPEVNEWLPGINSMARGKAVGDPMGKLTIEGEFNTSLAGVMLAVFTTAFVPVNGMTYFGRSQGGFYLDSATVTRGREEWHAVTAEFSSKYNVP